MKTISITVVQKCQASDKDYSKAWLTKLIEELSPEDVSLFCREIAHLNHYYSTSAGLYVTDLQENIIADSNGFWKMQEIDFNDPVTFKQIK